MVFEIENKVALITGGACGIGLFCAKELLRNGAKGVTIADISNENGFKAIEEIQNIFGTNKAIFIKTDVTDSKQFEAAFEETIKQFKNIDILINNTGIANEKAWEQEISVNINGTIHGMFLGMDKYLSKYKQTEEALIVNTASVFGTIGFGASPVYCATKHAILGMVKSWGNEDFYDETKIRVVGICPGGTKTPFFDDYKNYMNEGKYSRYWEKHHDFKFQDPEFVAKETMKVIKWAPNGTNWIIEGGEPAYEYIVPDRATMKQNVIRSQ